MAGPGVQRGERRGRPARSRRPLVVLGVVLLVVVVAAAVALPVLDRAARQAAARLVAEQAQRELGLAEPPDVGIGGGSFLWQAVRGRYPLVTVATGAYTHEGTTVQRPRVRLTDVRVPHAVLLGRGGTVRVGGGSAVALVPWSVVEARVEGSSGRDVALSADGQDVLAATTVTVLRREVPVALTARPVLGEASVRLVPQRARLGELTATVDDVRPLLEAVGLSALLGGVEVGLGPEAGVPEGVAVDGLRVAADGLLVSADVAATAIPVPAQ